MLGFKLSYTPAKRLFLAVTGLIALSLACFVWDYAALIWVILLGLFGAGVLIDLYLLTQSSVQLDKAFWRQQPTVQRPFLYFLDFSVFTPKGIRYAVFPIDSDVMTPSKQTAHLENLEDGRVRAVIELTPKRRGDIEWPGVLVRYRTRFGLLHKWHQLGEQTMAVYPKLSKDLQNQLNPELLMEHIGMKTNRHLRADQEFESLRPYVKGDNYRHIDWKASARLGSLISRQFQVEHHHNILVCLDTSRLMGTVTHGISKLDWAIEASLHLAYLAKRFNDRMGLMVFSNDIERWVKPQNHPVESFLNNLYSLECKVVEADFQKACSAILASQKKRSLVIFLSDFLDPSSLEPWMNAFGHLNRKHCSLFIGIEDPAYQKYLTLNTPKNPMDLSRKLVALDSMQRRRMTLQQLRQMGLYSLTVTPENLVRRAMEAYMEIKFQGAI